MPGATGAEGYAHPVSYPMGSDGGGQSLHQTPGRRDFKRSQDRVGAKGPEQFQTPIPAGRRLAQGRPDRDARIASGAWPRSQAALGAWLGKGTGSLRRQSGRYGGATVPIGGQGWRIYEEQVGAWRHGGRGRMAGWGQARPDRSGGGLGAPCRILPPQWGVDTMPRRVSWSLWAIPPLEDRAVQYTINIGQGADGKWWWSISTNDPDDCRVVVECPASHDDAERAWQQARLALGKLP